MLTQQIMFEASQCISESCGFHLLVLRIVLGRETSSHWHRIRTGARVKTSGEE